MENKYKTYTTPGGSIITELDNPPVQTSATQAPSIEEQLAEVNANQLTILDSIADLYIVMMPV